MYAARYVAFMTMAGALAVQLARHHADVPIGVNIGKSKITPAERAVDDG